MPDRRLSPLLLLLLALGAQAGGESYCCQEATSGRRICADTLPDACRGRAYRVLDSAGNVVKEVAAPLTAEQKIERAREETLQKQADEHKREQRRKDQALLDTYATLADIELSQKKAEDDVRFTLQAAQSRIAAARKQQQKLMAEAEFYKKKTLPADLDKALRAVNHEVKVESELIDVKQRELEQIKIKYDTDRKRFLELVSNPANRRSPNGNSPR
ncbi:hypothetical protein [Dechloromonas sp. ZS-1]|uniref:hypothetical protein n=1 Tax=Dechloromonas sp. ZS-1 TaxID=3138067 RepID=UPI0031FDB0D3